MATNSWEAFPPFLTARRDMAGELLPIAGERHCGSGAVTTARGANTTTAEYYSLALVPVELQRFTIE